MPNKALQGLGRNSLKRRTKRRKGTSAASRRLARSRDQIAQKRLDNLAKARKALKKKRAAEKKNAKKA